MNILRKWKWLLFIVLVGGLGYLGYGRWQQTQQAAQTTEEDAVKTARVRRGDIVLYASGTGKLVPAYEIAFGFGTSGQVSEIYAQVGDEVSAGDVLATLDDADARARLAQAERNWRELTSAAALAQAEADLAAAQENLNTMRNRLAWLISPGVLNTTERLQAAEARLAALKAEYGENPTEEQQAELDAAAYEVRAAEIALRSAKAYYEETYLLDNFAETVTNPKTGEVSIVYEYNEATGRDEPVIYPPSIFDIQQAWADYNLAQARYQEAQWYLDALQGKELPPEASGPMLTRLQQAQDELASARQALADTQLVAPADGTLLSLDLVAGQFVSTGPVAVVADLSQPYVEVYLDEIDWDKIAPGYDAEVIFDVADEKTYTGKVIRVDPALVYEQNTPLVHGLIALDGNQSGLRLPVGAGAAVDVIGGRAEDVLLVPIEALREISPGQYAVFVMEDGEPTLRMVEVGLKDLFFAEIISGLDAGEIVTTGIVETQP